MLETAKPRFIYDANVIPEIGRTVFVNGGMEYEGVITAYRPEVVLPCNGWTLPPVYEIDSFMEVHPSAVVFL